MKILAFQYFSFDNSAFKNHVVDEEPTGKRNNSDREYIMRLSDVIKVDQVNHSEQIEQTRLSTLCPCQTIIHNCTVNNFGTKLNVHHFDAIKKYC